jgi:hypothetical protein
MWSHFLPLHHTISKPLSKIIEKIFLTLFGPSFSLAIYMTWVVPFLHTHELIYSAYRRLDEKEQLLSQGEELHTKRSA